MRLRPTFSPEVVASRWDERAKVMAMLAASQHYCFPRYTSVLFRSFSSYHWWYGQSRGNEARIVYCVDEQRRWQTANGKFITCNLRHFHILSTSDVWSRSSAKKTRAPLLSSAPFLSSPLRSLNFGCDFPLQFQLKRYFCSLKLLHVVPEM